MLPETAHSARGHAPISTLHELFKPSSSLNVPRSLGEVAVTAKGIVCESDFARATGRGGPGTNRTRTPIC